MDEYVLQQIVALVDSHRTLARLACTNKILRSLVQAESDKRPHCLEFRRLLGLQAAGFNSAARAEALLAGSFRRQSLEDLAEAQQQGRCYDGRQQTWDLLSLPGGGKWLVQVQLLATDRQHVLMYDAQLQILGALSFVDRPAGMPAASGSGQPRTFYGILSSLLFKCSLSYGVVALEPPLLLGAADYLLHHQLQLGAREELAGIADAARWQRRWGPDDDAHLVRLSLLRVRLLQKGSLLGGSLFGTLDDALVRQLSSHGLLGLRLLDLSGAAANDDHIAELLALCPQLRVLHAAGKVALASLAVLAGSREQVAEVEQRGERWQYHQHQHDRHCSGAGASDTAHALQDLRLDSVNSRVTRAVGPAAADAAQPACPLLERLDLSGCMGLKASALRRALRCLTHLRDLRVNGCKGLHGLLDPLLQPAAQSGSRGAASLQTLFQLTTLEALDAEDLGSRHIGVLLSNCPNLRRLAISSKQLASEQFDRQQHRFNTDGGSSNAAMPSLEQLEVGWGTGGSFLLHLLAHSPALHSLTAHLGASVSDWHLQQVASSCPNLGRLCLKGSNVSEAGVALVLQSCTQLTSLQLLGCAGPFTDALAMATVKGPSKGYRAPAFKFQELQISWGAASLTDAGLAQLLSPARAALRVLVLKGCSSLTDAAWIAVQQHGGSLKCLHVESCGALAALGKAGSSHTSPVQSAMTADAAVAALTTCHQLLALTIRSCVMPSWSPKAHVARLRAACTALHTLDLA